MVINGDVNRRCFFMYFCTLILNRTMAENSIFESNDDEIRNEISQLGKYKLINHLVEQTEIKHRTTVVGVGDDAAVTGSGDLLTVTATKMFVENIHFDLTYFPLKHLGFKCVTIALTDVLAMNALPKQISICLAVSNRFSVEALEEFMTGVRACCHYFKIDITGLDITSSSTGMAISMTAIGEVEPERIARRCGAKENELICATGDFGAAYTGLLLLQREKQIFEATKNSQPDFEGYEYLLERQLKPEPRVEIIEKLREIDVVPTSMTAVTEGIATSLFHLCMPDTLGCTIFEGKIPLAQLTFDTLRKLKIVATTVALNGGEDYELLFTIRQDDYEKVKTVSEIAVIGYIGEKNGGRNLITNDNKQIELKAQGFIEQSK